MGITTAASNTLDRPAISIDAPEVLEVADLGKVLRRPDHAVHALNASGNGPRAFRVGRKLRWMRSEVEAWIGRQMGPRRQPCGLDAA